MYALLGPGGCALLDADGGALLDPVGLLDSKDDGGGSGWLDVATWLGSGAAVLVFSDAITVLDSADATSAVDWATRLLSSLAKLVLRPGLSTLAAVLDSN